MNDNELNAVLDVIHADLRSLPAPQVLHERVQNIPSTIRPHRDWLPRNFTGTIQPMFSATKFVVAAVIVALFGGFLLAGVLTTQDDQTVPAAVTSSPSDLAEPTIQPTESPATSVQTDLLPGIELVTEEVALGVIRVLNDGIRDLSSADVSWLSTGRDGSIWLHSGGRSIQLGQPGALERPLFWGQFQVTPDGVVWTIGRKPGKFTIVISSFDGEEWTDHKKRVHKDVPGQRGSAHGWDLDVTDEGTVWAAWPDPEDKSQSLVASLGPEGWQVLDQPVERSDLVVTDSGEVWNPRVATRYVGGTWEKARPEADMSLVGRDGTVWSYTIGVDGHPATLMRFDRSEWQECPVDGMPHGFVPLAVAADGSLWGSHYFDYERHPPVRFDCTTWDYPLPGQDAESMTIADDGSVWVLAPEAYPPDDFHLYVITPRVFAASDQP